MALSGMQQEERAYGDSLCPPTIERERIMDAKTAAKSIANTPTHVVVAGIQTIRNALTAAEAVVNSGVSSTEKTADELLAAVQNTAPTVVEPLLEALHLSSKPAP